MIAGDFDGRLALADLAGDALVVGLLRCRRRRDSGGASWSRPLRPTASTSICLSGVAGDELEGGLEDVGVECAGKALVAADDDQQHALLRPGDEERMAQVAGLLVEDDRRGGSATRARW